MRTVSSGHQLAQQGRRSIGDFVRMKAGLLKKNLSGHGIREEQHERSDDELSNIARPATKEQELSRTDLSKVGVGRNVVESRELDTSHRRIKFNVVCGSEDKGQEDDCYDQQGK